MLVLAGLICGVVGLAGTSRGGTQGALRFLIMGMVANGLVLELYIADFVHAWTAMRNSLEQNEPATLDLGTRRTGTPERGH